MYIPLITHARHLSQRYGPRRSALYALIVLTLCPFILPLSPGDQIAWLEVTGMIWATAAFMHLYQKLNIRSKLGLYLYFSGMVALSPSLVKAQTQGVSPPAGICDRGFFLIGPLLGAIDSSLGWFLNGALSNSICALVVGGMIIFFLVIIMGLFWVGLESHNSKRQFVDVLSQYMNIIITMIAVASIVTVFNLNLSNSGNTPTDVGTHPQPDITAEEVV